MKKLRLEELKVQSFITQIKNINGLYGRGLYVDDRGPTAGTCYNDDDNNDDGDASGFGGDGQSNAGDNHYISTDTC